MPQVDSVRINGPVLRALRTERGIPLSKLGPRIGRHPQSIRSLETGNVERCSSVFAHQIANALKVKVARFTLPEEEADGEAEPETADAA